MFEYRLLWRQHPTGFRPHYNCLTRSVILFAAENMQLEPYVPTRIDLGIQLDIPKKMVGLFVADFSIPQLREVQVAAGQIVTPEDNNKRLQVVMVYSPTRPPPVGEDEDDCDCGHESEAVLVTRGQNIARLVLVSTPDIESLCGVTRGGESGFAKDSEAKKLKSSDGG